MSRRNILLDKIIQAIGEHNWNLCTQQCFRVLYGLPATLQIELASYMMYRYLPIFEKQQPDIIWPRQLLSDVGKWVEQFDRSVPDIEALDFSANVSYSLSFDAILVAYSHRNHPFALTSASACAVESAIHARRSNVWGADDPEAVELWRLGRRSMARSPMGNVAAIAVLEREWREVVAWLKREQISTYPDEVNLELMERQLDYWMDNEMVLIVPEIAEIMGKILAEGERQS